MITRNVLLVLALGFSCADAATPSADEPAPGVVVSPDAVPAREPAPSAVPGTAAEEPVAEKAAAEPKTEAKTPPFDESRFWGTPEDPAAKELLAVREGLKGSHYLTGNEMNLQVFRDRLDGLGGAYVGVGSDQAYLFIAWMRADLGWLTDYDPQVVTLHRAYQALIVASDGPEAFLARFEKGGVDGAVAAIEAGCSGEGCKEVVQTYRRSRGSVRKRLTYVRDHMNEHGVPCWLTDAEQYAHVRKLVQERRIRPLVANWLEQGAVLAVGDATRDLNVPVRTLYLSNAEEYWKSYTPRFRANVAALPFDERAIVLRTIVTKEQNLDYHYNVQTADSYLAWLSSKKTRRVNQIVRHPRGKVKPRPPMYSETSDEPPAHN